MIPLLESGAFRLMCKHVQLKQNTWYYRRRIPAEVRTLHRHPTTGKPQVQLFFSLKTTDKREACRLADIETRRLDALWDAHRNGDGLTPNPDLSLARLKAAGLSEGDGIRFAGLDPVTNFEMDIAGWIDQGETRQKLSAQDQLTIDILHGKPVPKTLSDAKDKHLELGKGAKNKVGRDQFDRAWSILLEITGDKQIEQLTRADGNEFVKRLIDRGVGAETVKRYVSQVRPVISTGILEFELPCRNPFEKLTIPIADQSPRKPRHPYTTEQLRFIQTKCREVDDPRRWLIAMLSDTGARLSELLGMEQADVFLNDPVPHIWIRPNATRGLKTKQSLRRVPLVGASLWATQRAMALRGHHLFPSLLPKTTGIDFHSGGVSSALGKWQRENKLAGEGQTLHSFRHTLTDRLRNAETPEDLVDRITGWTEQGMRGTYGQGHGLEPMQKYMQKIVLAA